MAVGISHTKTLQTEPAEVPTTRATGHLVATVTLVTKHTAPWTALGIALQPL